MGHGAIISMSRKQKLNTRNTCEGNRTIMKIKGVLVDILYNMDPVEYGEYIVYERGEKVLYLALTKVLYRMLIVSLLWYKKLDSHFQRMTHA